MPSVTLETIWQHDPDHWDIREDCDGFDDENPGDWQAWQSEIRAATIADGEEITGSAYLGGTWERSGDVPEESNPTISGYEPQMTLETLEDLAHACEPDAPVLAEIADGLAFLNRFMREEYEKQRAKIESLNP